MKWLKHIYLAVLFLWLLACGVRWLLPYFGEYYSLYYTGGKICFCCYDDKDKMGKVPASRYAELNRQLETLHPGARYFFYPDKNDEWVGEMFVVPVQRDFVKMPPDVEAALHDWKQEMARSLNF